ncbi:MAG TPA: 3-dehydroquinate synthase [Opitutaceae bacterium]|nr:3-dehydroquinate synthase [Opitutaceae bacterium]
MHATPSPLAATLPVPFAHRLLFTREVFAPANSTLAQVLTPREPGERVRALLVCDAGLCAAQPELTTRAVAWFSQHAAVAELAAPPLVLPAGEAAKNDFAALERLWTAIADAGLCRHSYIVAVGGGALLDVAGFAAATAHRGIPLVRLPTTSLSQADSGVGVKCGVNRFGRKNWLGAFDVPHAVINDVAFLRTLPPRERRAGLAEAVKVALIRDGAFFEWLVARSDAIAGADLAVYEHAIATSARLHFEHIASGGDPFERGSARPLDFGHWAAHKLEQLSAFRLGHGDAVAVGLALDLVYARRAGLLDAAIAERALALLERFEFALHVSELDLRRVDGHRCVLDGLQEFREHLGGRLSIPMIRAPGVRVDLHAVDLAAYEGAADELRERSEARPAGRSESGVKPDLRKGALG